MLDKELTFNPSVIVIMNLGALKYPGAQVQLYSGKVAWL